MTRIEAGIADNVVPDRATATLNFRYTPDRTSEEAEDVPPLARTRRRRGRDQRRLAACPGGRRRPARPGAARSGRSRHRAEAGLDERRRLHLPRHRRRQFRTRRASLRPPPRRAGRDRVSRPLLRDAAALRARCRDRREPLPAARAGRSRRRPAGRRPSRSSSFIGGITGPFNATLRSPEIARRSFKLGEHLLFETTLPRRLVEMAVLIRARASFSQFEWYAHHHPALGSRARGGDLRRRSAWAGVPSAWPLTRTALFEFCAELAYRHRRSATPPSIVPRNALGERGVVELTYADRLLQHGRARAPGLPRSTLPTARRRSSPLNVRIFA